MHNLHLSYKQLSILFNSIKAQRQDLISKTYSNDSLLKHCKDESKRQHLMDLQDSYYAEKEQFDNLYFMIQESLDQIV
jgi:hypothetical protein